MADFPVLDGNRDTREGRVVIDECGELQPYIDEMDGWVSMPTRVAYTPAAGIVLEIGPYTLDDREITRLGDAIRGYHDIANHGRLRRIK